MKYMQENMVKWYRISFNYSKTWCSKNVISNKIMLIPDILELDSSVHLACTMKHPVPETQIIGKKSLSMLINIQIR